MADNTDFDAEEEELRRAAGLLDQDDDEDRQGIGEPLAPKKIKPIREKWIGSPRRAQNTSNAQTQGNESRDVPKGTQGKITRDVPQGTQSGNISKIVTSTPSEELKKLSINNETFRGDESDWSKNTSFSFSEEQCGTENPNDGAWQTSSSKKKAKTKRQRLRRAFKRQESKRAAEESLEGERPEAKKNKGGDSETEGAKGEKEKEKRPPPPRI